LKAGKKGKKHNPSPGEGVQHCANNTVKQGKKTPVIGFSALFFAEA